MSGNQVKTFRIRTIEVKKGVAFETGRVHNNVSYGLVIDVNEDQVDSIRNAAEVIIDGWLTQKLNDSRKSQSAPKEPLSSDTESLQWNDSIGRGGPLQIISVTDDKTRELRDKIYEGTKQFGGYSYWIFPDGTTIGRRKLQ